jgi:hypothetical protein
MTPLRELMAERDIIDELFEAGGGKIVVDRGGPTESVIVGRGLRVECPRTIFMRAGWVIYKDRMWRSADARFVSYCEAEINGLLCELLPKHPEIDTVLIGGCVSVAPGGLTFILSPTIKHVICPLLDMADMVPPRSPVGDLADRGTLMRTGEGRGHWRRRHETRTK